jgi:hypothetical protein
VDQRLQLDGVPSAKVAAVGDGGRLVAAVVRRVRVRNLQLCEIGLRVLGGDVGAAKRFGGVGGRSGRSGAQTRTQRRQRSRL